MTSTRLRLPRSCSAEHGVRRCNVTVLPLEGGGPGP